MDSEDKVLMIYKRIVLLDDADFLCLCDLFSSCDNAYVLNLLTFARNARFDLKNKTNINICTQPCLK